MKAAVGRSVSSLAAVASVALLLTLTFALFTSKGVRLWERPIQAVAGGMVAALATYAGGAVAWNAWRNLIRPSRATGLAVLFLAIATLGSYLVLNSTSSAYTPSVEIIGGLGARP